MVLVSVCTRYANCWKDDIEFTYTDTTSRPGAVCSENSSTIFGINSNDHFTNDDLFVAPFDFDSRSNSPFSVTTPNADALDLRDVFDSSNFLVDDFWRFSE